MEAGTCAVIVAFALDCLLVVVFVRAEQLREDTLVNTELLDQLSQTSRVREDGPPGSQPGSTCDHPARGCARESRHLPPSCPSLLLAGPRINPGFTDERTPPLSCDELATAVVCSSFGVCVALMSFVAMLTGLPASAEQGSPRGPWCAWVAAGRIEVIGNSELLGRAGARRRCASQASRLLPRRDCNRVSAWWVRACTGPRDACSRWREALRAVHIARFSAEARAGATLRSGCTWRVARSRSKLPDMVALVALMLHMARPFPRPGPRR